MPIFEVSDPMHAGARSAGADSVHPVVVLAVPEGRPLARLDSAQLTPRSSSRYLVTVSSSSAGLTLARKHPSMERSAVPVRFTVSA